MALRECKGPMLACIACAGALTCCLWPLGDSLSKEPAGPLFWLVGALIGLAIGAAAGLVACLLARPNKALGAVDARIADEREVLALRYLLGILFALFGAVIGIAFFADPVHSVVLRYFGTW